MVRKLKTSEQSAEPEEEFQIPEQPPNETHTCVKENEQELVYYLYEEPNTQEGLKCELLYNSYKKIPGCKKSRELLQEFPDNCFKTKNC